MEFTGGWEAMGKVVEKKALTSKKSDTWRGWMVRVQVLGATLEVMCNEEAYNKIHEGELISCRGRLEARPGGGYNLEVEEYKTAPAKSVA